MLMTKSRIIDFDTGEVIAEEGQGLDEEAFERVFHLIYDRMSEAFSAVQLAYTTLADFFADKVSEAALTEPQSLFQSGRNWRQDAWNLYHGLKPAIPHYHKCPNCGTFGDDLDIAIDQAYGNFTYTEGVFTAYCPECGHEIGVEATAEISFKVEF